MSNSNATWWRAAVVLASAVAFIRCLIETAFVTEWGHIIGETMGFDGLSMLFTGWMGVLHQPLLFVSIIAGWVCACTERYVAATIWASSAIGVMVIFPGLVLPNVGYVAWIANPIIVATWFLYLGDRRPAAFISAVVALGLTVTFLSVADVPLDEKFSPLKIISYGNGYWLWVVSAAVLVAGATVDAFVFHCNRAPLRDRVPRG